MERWGWGVGALICLAGCGDIRLWNLPGDPPGPRAGARAVRPNPIPAENALPGEPRWAEGQRSRSHEVELYLSTDSAAAGEALSVRVSTSVPAEVTLEVFRLGHYGGAGARRVWSSASPLPTFPQAPCASDVRTRRISCNWLETARLRVGQDWVSGLYVVKAVRGDGHFRFSPLVVRDDRAAEILFGAGVNTYQAYNAWGGASLYEDDSGTMPSGRAHEVSFERPYDGDEGAGQQLRYESHLARFLEQHGYDVTYASNLDFVRDPHLLEGIGAFVHGGHDEYWNPEQREALDAALARGALALLHFGGNGAYWRTRAVLDARGEPRTLACYKSEPQSDPIPGSTLRYRDPGVDLPESLLLGAMYDGWQTTPFPLVVHDESHWIFEGTGLRNGDLLPGLLGYEYDKVHPGVPAPAGMAYPFESPVLSAEGIPSRSHAVSFQLPGGARVFSAGTIYWALGLSGIPGLQDSRVERMTLNALEHGLAPRRSARALPPLGKDLPQYPPPDGRWARRVERFAGAPGLGGHRDGPADQALFNGPTGLALLPGGALAVADTVGNRIRIVSPDAAARTVITAAGNGRYGYADGAGADAMFRAPIGLAAFPDGTLAVADSDNHVLRRLVPAGNGWTVELLAGTARTPGGLDGAPHLARFNRPTALALDGAGALLVVDQAGHRLRRVSADGMQVMTLAGGLPGFADANVGTAAQFNSPSAVAVGRDGAVYLFDSGNQKLRRVDGQPPHAVTTLAGRVGTVLPGYWQQGGSFGFSDGRGSDARFLAQMGLAVDGVGALLLGDGGNGRIRKILPGSDAASTQVVTLAGSGRVGMRTGPADEADVTCPAGVLVTPNDRVFVSDPFHGQILEVIR